MGENKLAFIFYLCRNKLLKLILWIEIKFYFNTKLWYNIQKFEMIYNILNTVWHLIKHVTYVRPPLGNLAPYHSSKWYQDFIARWGDTIWFLHNKMFLIWWQFGTPDHELYCVYFAPLTKFLLFHNIFGFEQVYKSDVLLKLTVLNALF